MQLYFKKLSSRRVRSGIIGIQLEGREVNGYETKFSIVDGNNVLNIFPSEDNLATTFPY
jgi:hypothetical protein